MTLTVTSCTFATRTDSWIWALRIGRCLLHSANEHSFTVKAMHKRVHDRPMYAFQDVRIITKAIRDLLKIGYPKDEVPLKKPRASVQVQNIYNMYK